MSFSFSTGGTKEETLSSLRKLDSFMLGNDGLGIDIRDLLVKRLEQTELPEPHQVYTVHASGHHHAGTPMVLLVRVELGDRPPVDTE